MSDQDRQRAYYQAHEVEMIKDGVTLQQFLFDCQGPRAVSDVQEVSRLWAQSELKEPGLYPLKGDLK